MHVLYCFFFFKQKTAYEMRISDWSSDVCSSDLIEGAGGTAVALGADLTREAEVETLLPRAAQALGPLALLVNNASLFEMDVVDTATRASDRKSTRLNSSH